jgi:hypothetical protein
VRPRARQARAPPSECLGARAHAAERYLFRRRAARDVELAALEDEFRAEYAEICAEEEARSALAAELRRGSISGDDGKAREDDAGAASAGPAVVAVAADGTQSSGGV